LCSACHKKHRDLYAPAIHQRPWTARERELLRRDWDRRPRADIAAELGRKAPDVYAAAVRFGVHKPGKLRRPIDGNTDRAVLHWHGCGLSNREIGRRLKRSHVSVQRVLDRHGLHSNCRRSNREPFPPRWREQIGRKFKERIRRDGLFHALPCLRHLIPERAEVARMGWGHLVGTLLEARILEFLARCGPQTVEAICAAVGRVSHWTRLVTRTLRNRGLLANYGRQGKYVLYGLAEGTAPSCPRCGAEMVGGAPHGDWPIQWECPRCHTIVVSSSADEIGGAA
jgi:ribosomal protein S27AE